MSKQFLNAFINDSPTIRETAGADITSAAHKAVMYDNNGNVVIATSGEKAVGIVISTAAADIVGDNLITKTGENLDVLIKEIGLIEVAENIKKGNAITINSSGQAIVATSGTFVFGFAFTSASAGELVQIQITKSGKI